MAESQAREFGPGVMRSVWLWLDERNRGGDLNVDQQLRPTLHLLVQSSLPGRQHGTKLLEVALAQRRDTRVDLQEALGPVVGLGVRHSVVVLSVFLDERVFVVIDHDEFLGELVEEGPELLRLGVGEGHVRGDELSLLRTNVFAQKKDVLIHLSTLTRGRL